MPRKLAKSGTLQFLDTLERFETEVYRQGADDARGDLPGIDAHEREREVGKLRNLLIKLFENRGA